MQHLGDKTRGGDVLDFMKPFLGVSNLLFISFHKIPFLPTIGDIVDWNFFYSLFHFLPNPKTCCFRSSWGAKPHLAVECVDQLKDKKIDRNLDTLDDVKKNKKERIELSFDLAARFYRQSFLFSSCSAQLGPSLRRDSSTAPQLFQLVTPTTCSLVTRKIRNRRQTSKDFFLAL